MVTLKIIRPSYDKYKITVNGQRIELKSKIKDDSGRVCDSVELEPTEKFEIVIKRKLSSVVACFFANLMALIGLMLKECGVKVINGEKYSIENPEKTDGEIIIRLNQGIDNWNSIAVSEGLTIN